MKKIYFILLPAVIFIISCASDQQKVKRASQSREYQEYVRLMDESILDLRSHGLEHIDENILRTYASVEDLVADSIIAQNSMTYKYFKNFEKMSVLDAQIEKKFGVKASEISSRMYQIKRHYAPK